MTRGWAMALAAGIALAVSSPARAQIGIILASGSGPEPTTTAAYWVSAPSDVRALAVAEIVTLSMNPLNAHLVMMAADGTPKELPNGIQNPAVPLPFAPGGGALLYGGNPPANQLGTPPDSGGGGGGGGPSGGGGTSGIGNGTPLLTLAVNPPTETDPGSVTVTATNGSGLPFGTGVSVPFPYKGWWTLGAEQFGDIGTTPPPSTTPPPPTPNPTPDPDPTPNPPPPPPPPAVVDPPGDTPNTPEPATAVLALIGAAAVGATRRRKR